MAPGLDCTLWCSRLPSSRHLTASSDLRNISASASSLFGHEAMRAEWSRRRREVCVLEGGGGEGGASEAAEHRLWSQLCNTTNVRPSHKMRPFPCAPVAGWHFFSLHQRRRSRSKGCHDSKCGGWSSCPGPCWDVKWNEMEWSHGC